MSLRFVLSRTLHYSDEATVNGWYQFRGWSLPNDIPLQHVELRTILSHDMLTINHLRQNHHQRQLQQHQTHHPRAHCQRFGIVV
jgi:hypothetical protein